METTTKVRKLLAMPAELLRRLQESARANRRSVSAEIVYRLERSFDHDQQ